MTDVVEIMARAIYDAADKEDYVSDYRFHDGDTCFDGNFNLDALARAALTALESAGWCVVPREPTPRMNRAFVDAQHDGKSVWSAMLSAAPRPRE